MIRGFYICNQVLRVYRLLPEIVFPLEPMLVLAKLDNCRVMTYQKFAEINNCTVADVIELCESQSGCTHYDVANDRYLVLYSDSSENYNVKGRIQWTKSHELGHIVCEHLPYVASAKMAENGFNNLSHPELEAEADYFASEFLSPLPLFSELGISSPADAQRLFGLSGQASENRWNQYLKWKANHRKTAWENDMKRVYRERSLPIG